MEQRHLDKLGFFSFEKPHFGEGKKKISVMMTCILAVQILLMNFYMLNQDVEQISKQLRWYPLQKWKIIDL